MNTMKIVGLLFAAVLLGFSPALAIPAPPVYGTCYNVSVPSPAPTVGQATVPICVNGVLQTSGSVIVTPTPFSTATGNVLLVQPTNVPTLGVTVQNTPGVVIQNTSIPITAATTLPVSGAFPTPIPFPTLGVVCISGCATPIPFPTLGANVLNTPTVNAGTGFPTPLALQPVSLPTSFQTAFPTPIPFPTLGANILNTPTVNQGTSPWVVTTPPPTTTVTVTQGTASNLNATVVGSGNFNVVPGTAATPSAITTPASSASSVTLLASNATRNGWTVCNNSTQILYLAKAATATTSAYTLPFPAAGVIPTCYIESGVSVYRGIITGIWASANGTAIVTEW